MRRNIEALTPYDEVNQHGGEKKNADHNGTSEVVWMRRQGEVRTSL
jgi:hypothetical protein